MANTFANELTPQEVTLALEHLLIAPFGTSWTPARIDVAAPPANFFHAGAVVDDSPQISITKSLYQVQVGIPASLAYQAVTGLAGQFTVGLHTFDAYGAYLSLGGLPPYITPQTATSGFGTILTTPNTRTLINVSTVHDFAVNDMVITDTTAALNTSRNYAWVTAVVSVATGKALTLQGNGLPFTPTDANPVVAVDHSSFALGTGVLPNFMLLGVADGLNGMQIIHEMRRAQPVGEWAEALRNGQHVMQPLNFNIYGFTVSSPHSSSGQLVLALRHQFAPTTTQ